VLRSSSAIQAPGGGPKREATLVILDRRKRTCRITLGADKAYDATAFVEEIAINGAVSKHGVVRKTATDGRTIRHAGMGSANGWIKAQASLTQPGRHQ
jgi:hypothetical protein